LCITRQYYDTLINTTNHKDKLNKTVKQFVHKSFLFHIDFCKLYICVTYVEDYGRSWLLKKILEHNINNNLININNQHIQIHL